MGFHAVLLEIRSSEVGVRGRIKGYMFICMIGKRMEKS